MKTFTLIVLILVPLIALAVTPAPNVAGYTVEELAPLKGYAPEEIIRYFPPIEDWSEIDPSLQPYERAEGYAEERFPAQPKPYVHPRIYFGPEEIPAIRERIQTVYLSRIQMELLRSRCLQIAPSPEAWEAMEKVRTPIREVDPETGVALIKLPRKGYHGPWVGGWLNDLASGKEPEALKNTWNIPHGQVQGKTHLHHLLPMEALRCLLDNDVEGGRRLGKALATLSLLYSAHVEAFQAVKDWGRIYQIFGSDSIPVAYDWAYNFMTREDQETVRAFIAGVTRGKRSIGFDHVPAFPGNTSNHGTMHMHIMSSVLAIEGEEGFDPIVYENCLNLMKKWCYVATGPLGAPFEGYSKSAYAGFHLMALAKRNGGDILGTQWIKNAGRLYHLATMLPWGTEHVYESYNNIMHPRGYDIFKYAYPADRVIDHIYGNLHKDDFTNPPKLDWVNIRTTYAPFFPYTLIMDDPLEAKDGTYDFAASFTRLIDELKASQEPTFFYSDYRGLLTTRTSWDKDAAFMLFETRNIPGGHSWDCRNDFLIASHGRTWNYRPFGTNGEGPSFLRSVILIDDVGQGHQCPPGRTLMVGNGDKLTIAVGDATWAYRYKNQRTGRIRKDETVLEAPPSPNDSRLISSKLPWMDLSYNELPGWMEGVKGKRRHANWVEHNPIEYAYRTVLMRKGAHPYWIIRDDLRKDDEPHDYTWLMQTADDLKVIEPAALNGGGIDIVIGDDEGRRLLVRVFEAGSDLRSVDLEQFTIQTFEYHLHRKDHRRQRLEIPVNAVEGNYTVLLYPHREGDPLPKTAYALSRKKMRVCLGEQDDVYRITRDASGKSLIKQLSMKP